MGASLSRPLVARKLVEIAEIEQAPFVAYAGRSRAAIACVEHAARDLNRSVDVIAPAHEWRLEAADKLRYAHDHGIILPADVEQWADENLWARSVRCESASTESGPYALTRAPGECPDEPAVVELAFHRGMPTSVNGVAMPLVDLIGSLTIIAGAHGVGRIANPDPVRLIEAPAAVVLHAAHSELRRLVVPPEVDRFSRLVAAEYAAIVQSGRWFGGLREGLDVFVDKALERATGSIRLQLLKGECRVLDSEGETDSAIDRGRPLHVLGRHHAH
jgi:argininosuccinate synthase